MVAAVAGCLVVTATGIASARAEPGCERVPILGLNPQIREICDGPIQPDGSWVRARQFSSPQFTRSSCGGVYFQGGCPWWLPNDATAAWAGQAETYIVTPGTIPPGEPGHLG